jgi:hypothetical protein
MNSVLCDQIAQKNSYCFYFSLKSVRSFCQKSAISDITIPKKSQISIFSLINIIQLNSEAN